MRETLLFFLIVMINGLICINSNIGLDMCPNGDEERRSSINCKSVKYLTDIEYPCLFFFFPNSKDLSPSF